MQISNSNVNQRKKNEQPWWHAYGFNCSIWYFKNDNDDGEQEKEEENQRKKHTRINAVVIAALFSLALSISFYLLTSIRFFSFLFFACIFRLFTTRKRYTHFNCLKYVCVCVFHAEFSVSLVSFILYRMEGRRLRFSSGMKMMRIFISSMERSHRAVWNKSIFSLFGNGFAISVPKYQFRFE